MMNPTKTPLETEEHIHTLEQKLTRLERENTGLRKQQDLLESLHDNIALGITVWNSAGVLLHANKGFTDLTGYSQNEIPDLKSWFPAAYPDPDYRARVMADWAESSQAPHDIREFRVACLDGSRKEIEFRGVFLPDGKAIVTLADITNRKQIERALKTSEERYRTIWENSGAASAIIRDDTTIDGVNSEFEKLSRRSRHEIEGKMSWTEFVMPEDLEKMKRYHATRRQAGGSAPRRYEFGFVDRNGDVKHVVNTVSLIPGTTHSISSLIDISARKEMEEQLRESEEFYTKLIATLPEIVVRMDLDGKVLFVNDVVKEISGYDPSDLTGKNMLDFVVAEDHERVVQNALLMRENKLGPQSYHMLMKDGPRRLFEVNGDVLRTEDGTPYGMVNVLRDISQRKQLEKQLIQAHKMEAIGTLAGGIAHDFNNILSAIIGYSEISLPETSPGSPVNSNLKKVLNAGGRARDLVKQILTFSRQNDQEKLPVKIVPIVKEVVKFLRASLPTTIEIVLECEHDETVLADPTQIHQIIMNLCTNAAHAMEDGGGVLTLNLQKVTRPTFSQNPGIYDSHLQHHPPPGDYYRIAVTDTGSGIPSEIRNRIFDPFFTTKKTGKGTGMGLSVVHGIVKSHGGKISVSSEPGRGSSFAILLPIVDDPADETVERPLPLPTGNECILFVDDEPFQLDLGEQLLRRLGYEVVTSQNSPAALALFKDSPRSFDLVMTDMTMPEMTGDLLAAEIKSINPDIPIILCTGFSEKVSNENLSSLKIDALLMKPVVVSELAGTIRRLLDT